MKIVQTSANYRKPKGEFNHSPSLTVPDQSLTVRQLLDNHTRGHHFKNTRIPVYDPDNDLPDLRTLDLTEVDDLRTTLNNNVLEAKDIVKQNQKKYVEAIIRKKANATKPLALPPNAESAKP